MKTSFAKCMMCPRRCGKDRRVRPDMSFEKGFCQESDEAFIAWAGLHKGEEPPISGENGSGMLFFRGCSLGCSGCQNSQISRRGRCSVKTLKVDESLICSLAWDMSGMGAATISFVTPEHFTPLVVRCCKRLRAEGFLLPFVINTSGWISTEAIDDLFPFADIWLWDCKTHDPETARLHFADARYAEEERRSFSHLMSMSSSPIDFGRPKRPFVLVRHLMIPGAISSCIGVIRDFAAYKSLCSFSLLTQYIGFGEHTGARVSAGDVRRAKRALERLGIENGFFQPLGDDGLDWRPDFSRANPFAEGFAVPSPLFSRKLSEGADTLL